ncbi:MAG TPA: MSMEG_4193 family putative phosphomutase [Acidimicrobiales bacterium]|nr:MSMEG_4193 family putative phosphomutase [Acidimicrobiales bacterium]
MATSAPTVVIFVRHGQTPSTGKVLPGRAVGLALAEKGREQAQAVADHFREAKNVAAVYASPLQRTKETAMPIGKAVGMRVKPDKGLLECDFGEWTGASLAKLRKLPEWKAVQRNPSGFRFPGGESFAEMSTRMSSTVDRYRAAHPGKTVIAVSHADPIKAAAASALGVPLDLFQRIDISPCSMTVIAYTHEGPFVHCVNRVVS